MDSIKALFSSSGGSSGGLPGAAPGEGSLYSTGGPSSPSSFIQKFMPWVLAGGGVAGTVGNIQGNQARNAVLSAEMARMNAYNKLTPAQVTEGITSLEQPLSKNLTNAVGNTVQGQLAERGLSQAPGIFASSLAQGIAPYQLQEQQLAQQAYFQKLGLPISAQPSPFGPFPQQTNTSQLWQALMSKFMTPGGGGGSIVPGPDNVGSNPDQFFQSILWPSTGLTSSSAPLGAT
jgi:hypothetical protein